MNLNLDEIIRERLKERGYCLQDTLGIGGFGITYLAFDQMSKKNCVIKALKTELLQFSKSALQKIERLNNYIHLFRNEAGVLLRCKHPRIVEIYGILSEPLELQIGTDEILTYKLELPFLVMEYIEGENLHELVSKQNSFLPEVEVLHYIQQIGEALCALHNARLLHRDIKPQNIMVRTLTHDAVLIDFGIARDFLPDVTQSHTVSYTPCYAPPEQLRRRGKRGKYTDIYGLAATLYYLLTNQPPIEAYERQLGEPLKEPQEINPNISHRVAQAILWGMELESHKRPQTVEEWLTELLSSDPLLFPNLTTDNTRVSNTPTSPIETQNTWLCDLECDVADNLMSNSHVDYTQLCRYLAAQSWKDADYETYLVMLKVVGRKEGDWITKEELLDFPCTDLRAIDRLWVKYTNGRFGFSVQKQVYLEVGGIPDGKFYRDAWRKFGEVIGWRVEESWIQYNEVIFDMKAPIGHLPTPPCAMSVGGFQAALGGRKSFMEEWSVWGCSLAFRLANCDL